MVWAVGLLQATALWLTLVLSATVSGSGMAVLNGVRVELGTGAVTVDADDLRAGLSGLRRRHQVAVTVTNRDMWVRPGEQGDMCCRLLPDPFPEYRASVTGPDIDITFELTTLYPAVSAAIGADLLLDLRGSERPVTVRSADHGDLITLAMPTRPTRNTRPAPEDEDDSAQRH